MYFKLQPTLVLLAGLDIVCAQQVPFYAATQSSGKKQVQNVLTPGFDHFVEQTLHDLNSPGGVGVAVVQMNEDGTWNIETKGYGTAKGDGSKVTEDTYFAIGSNSKLFDVFAVGLLVHNESLSPRISWDTKIASILPEWGLQDSIAASESTIIDLMSHRTGLPRHDLMYEFDVSMADLLSRSKHLRPSTGFREQWQYNNIMYTVLSYLPKTLIPSLPSYARYVKDNIFVPLGLNQTTFDSYTAEKSGNLAQGLARDHVNKTENLFGKGTTRILPHWNPSTEEGNMISGAGGILMTPRNAATWLQTLLLLGKNPEANEIIIPSEVVQKAATGVSVVSGSSNWPEMSPVVYGGGQAIYSYRGHAVVEHTGGTPGFLTLILRLPSDNVGIAVFTNDNSYGALIMEILNFHIMDQVLRLEAIDWSTRLKSLISASYNQSLSSLVPRPSNPINPSVSFSSIAGIYNNPAYGSLELCLVSGSLKDRHMSDSCRILLKEVPLRLPDTVNASVPTLLARWDKLWVTHLKLEHFERNLFNASILSSMPIPNSTAENPKNSQTYWVSPWVYDIEATTAEIAVDGNEVSGIGIVGIWGAGQGIGRPRGDNVEQRAEVWFAKG
ncbi:hypothetical protein VKT23_013115 [Stygiomarasmius scandens]|uniref:Beta-lactamase-related domain-containing protein n=1 Tax=Marasmiellus scandens TaxID=2682957 RepID=A0ABR1J7G7_9AGAR